VHTVHPHPSDLAHQPGMLLRHTHCSSRPSPHTRHHYRAVLQIFSGNSQSIFKGVISWIASLLITVVAFHMVGAFNHSRWRLCGWAGCFKSLLNQPDCHPPHRSWHPCVCVLQLKFYNVERKWRQKLEGALEGERLVSSRIGDPWSRASSQVKTSSGITSPQLCCAFPTTAGTSAAPPAN
jgi:hypothetical protein